MYSIKNLLTQEPSAISGFVVATLNLLVLASVIHITKDLVVASNAVLILGLNLFYVKPLTASKSALKELGNGDAVAPPGP